MLLVLSAWLSLGRGAEVGLLVDNLDFETATFDGRPAVWKIADGGMRVTRDCGVAHGGACSLRFEGSDSANPRPSAVFQAFQGVALAGRRVHLSGWVRVEGGDILAGMDLQSGPADDLRQEQAIATRADAADWRRLDLTTEAGPDAEALVFGVWCRGSGRAWFDDLVLEIDGLPTRRLALDPVRVPERPVPGPDLVSLDALRVTTGAAPAIPAPWREDVVRRARPLRSLVSEDFADLQFLKPLLRDKRIVQLGEASHGVAEFDWMKVRLVRFLHRELGFDVLAFEGNTTTCDASNVHLARHDPGAAMADCLFSVWRTREVADLFDGMAESSGDERTLMIAGFDDQDSGSSPRIAETFDSLLRPIAPELAARIEQAERQRPAPAASLSQHVADYERAESLLVGLRARLPSGDGAARGLALAAQEAGSRAVLARQEANPYTEISGNLRDRRMAENLDFVADTLHPGRRIIVWAHNSHVRKDATNRDIATSMGHWTDLRRGAEVYTIGLFAGRGVYRTVTPRPGVHAVRPMRADSVEAVLANAGWAWCFFDLGAPDSAGADGWTEAVLRSGIEEGGAIVPRRSYDGILYIDLATPPADLP